MTFKFSVYAFRPSSRRTTTLVMLDISDWNSSPVSVTKLCLWQAFIILVGPVAQ